MFLVTSLSVLKWVSIQCIPLRKFCTLLNPQNRESGRTPTAELTLNLPPTHSQKPKTLSSLIPNSAVALRLVETAHKCFESTAASSTFASIPLKYLMICYLQVLAFNMVSAVVNVLLTITKRVLSTSSPSVALKKSIGSTFAKNFNVLPAESALHTLSCLRASKTNSGPRNEPPIPMATMFFRFFPECPVTAPLLILSVNCWILWLTS